MYNYHITSLEDWVKELYQQMGIMNRYQLDMLNLKCINYHQYYVYLL